MPIPKPKWNYENKLVHAPPASDKLMQEIKEILNLNDSTLREIEPDISSAVISYRLCKEYTSRYNPDYPTGGELKAAASAIIKDVDSLNNKLSLDAGGIKGFYKYYDPFNTMERHEVRTLEGLVSDLEFLKTCCVDAIRRVDTEGHGSDATGIPPKKMLVQQIAFTFRKKLHVEPTIYFSGHHEQGSQYAKVLAACFKEVDNSVPKSLKGLMAWERNYYQN
tara:strand:+ start:16992 stop:17654 length:663 start_codon:yes stop_codon:yes gene_type:complete